MRALAWAVLLPAVWLVACATGTGSVPMVVTSESVAKLQNRQWELKSITLDSVQMVMDMQANMTLVFGPDGRVMGYASVNRFTGAYSFGPDGRLSWPSPGLVTTRKAGPPELMEKERAYLNALPKTDRATLRDRVLRLQSGDESTILIFSEAGAP